MTQALTIDAALPPLIAVDQEGGDVSRLPWDTLPSALTLKDQPVAATADAFAGRGGLVKRAGIGVNFGVVADVTDDPGMFIYRRALGTTPAAAAERVAAAVTGEDGQVYTTLKHFPGHGAAPGDSHSGIPSSTESKAEWAASDALPFDAGIAAGAQLLMFGHLAYTSIDPAPATLSPEWHRVAREEHGFGGVIVTDDLGMLQASGLPEYQDPVANAVHALAAGNDLLLTVVSSTPETAPRIVDGIVAAVEAGEVPAARLDDAAMRVTALRLGLAASGRGLVPCEGCASLRVTGRSAGVECGEKTHAKGVGPIGEAALPSHVLGLPVGRLDADRLIAPVGEIVRRRLHVEDRMSRASSKESRSRSPGTSGPSFTAHL